MSLLNTGIDRRELRVGAIGIVAILLIAVGMGAASWLPWGADEYSAELESAQSVRVGDDVRLAGVPVGKVTSLTLRPGGVDMTFTVRSEVFVGNQSTLDVRMLTIVGGNYVALTSAGASPLGDAVIPRDRVRLPYSLMQTFQDAYQPLSALDPRPATGTLARLADSLESAPDSVARLLRSANTLVDVIGKQRADVSKAAALAAEYTTTINATKTDLGRLVAKVNMLEDLLVNNRAELRSAVQALSRVTWRIGALEPVYQSTLRPMAVELAEAADGLVDLATQTDSLITDVHAIAKTLDSHLEPGASPASPFCVPVPGKDC